MIGSEKSVNSKACVGALRWKIWDEEDTSNPQMCEKSGLFQHQEVEENYILVCSDIWRLKNDLVIQTKNRYWSDFLQNEILSFVFPFLFLLLTY